MNKLIENKKDIVTYSEIVAYQLLRGEKSLTTEFVDYHKSADRIILLAEKIKAERATIAMQRCCVSGGEA